MSCPSGSVQCSRLVFERSSNVAQAGSLFCDSNENDLRQMQQAGSLRYEDGQQTAAKSWRLVEASARFLACSLQNFQPDTFQRGRSGTRNRQLKAKLIKSLQVFRAFKNEF